MFGSGIRCANAERRTPITEPNIELEHELRSENTDV